MRIWPFILAVPLLAAPGRVIDHPKPDFFVEGLAEGADGVYLAGNYGLYRYDGFRYRQIEEYPFRRAHAVHFTSDGVMWVGSEEEGLVRRGADGAWVVVSREPAKIGPAVGRYLFVQDIPARRLRRVDAGGGSREVPLPWECGVNASAQGELWVACDHAVYRLRPEEMRLRAVTELPGARSAVPDGEGRVWLLTHEAARAWRDGRVVEEFRGTGRLRGIVTGPKGQVWLWDQTTVRGWPMGAEVTATVRGVTVDRRGHAWLVGDELREVVPEGWEQWPVAEFGASPVQILRNARQELIAVTEGRLFRLDERSRKWQALSQESRRYAYVLPLPEGEMLASVRDYGVVRLTAEGRLRSRLPPSEALPLQDDFRGLARSPDGLILAGSKKGLFRVEGNELKMITLQVMKNWPKWVAGQQLQEAHAVDFAADRHGQLWMGYMMGLAKLLSDGRWQPLRTEPDIREVRSFAFGRDGEIWVAHRGARRYFSRVRDGKATRYTVAEGYGPNETYFLKTDRRGWVWRGTSRGVYVSDGNGLLAQDWLFSDTGAECAQYGFFEDRDGSVWIAGTMGVVHVRPADDWFRERPGTPVVTKGLPEVLDPPRRWTVEMAKLPGAGEWPEPFRYRVMPLFADWRVARGGRAEVPDLPAGSYRLEIRQVGLQGVWRQEFRVGPPPIWRWWWMLLPVFAMGAYRRRAWLEYRWRRAWFHWHRWGRRAPVPAVADWTGSVLQGHYRIERKLSASGFAQVYAGVDEWSGKPVAVKVMGHRSGDAAWVRARFAQEVAALHTVAHPGVIAILDSWIQATGELCLVTPLIEGRTLREELKGEPWPVARVAPLCRALGKALTAVHRAGIVHRDVKPENILLRPNGEPMLIDFGASGLLGPQEAPAVTKVLTGTIEYLAPERLTGQYSAGSDIYSFATVVFELLTGKKWADLGMRLSVEGLTQLLGKREFAALLAKALDPLPENRPGEASDWAHRLADELER